ncbi:hypothetical protein P8452_57479 [Trifolium repens]|nr:hypothetical protein P8452_57479 [Trifolium repens]
MASSSSFSISSSSSTLIDGKLPSRQSASPQCVSLPSLPPPPVQSHTRSPWKTTSFCRKIARNVMSMASSTTTDQETTAASPEQLSVSDDSPEFLKTVQQAWEKVEDKYAVSTLAVAGTVALWGTAGVISAIDRLPLIPGVLEVVGIGYTGMVSTQRWKDMHVQTMGKGNMEVSRVDISGLHQNYQTHRP